MCKAFSAVVRHDGKVFWKAGLDSHEDIKKLFKLDDIPMSALRPHVANQLCPVEITPDKGYLHPEGKWTFKFDEKAPPWWRKPMEDGVWKAFEEWKTDVYSKINISEAQNPIHPFKIVRKTKVTKLEIKLLINWDSVRDSVWDSVRDSVWDSVWDSVRDSVWDSVWGSVRDSVRGSVWDSVRDSVWDSVRDSVWGYVGSLFKLPRGAWKNTSKLPKKPDYPFQSAADLWKRGLVPSFDGTTWRLHSGAKAEVVYEISQTELRKMAKSKGFKGRNMRGVKGDRRGPLKRSGKK
jgi:hypothetical protein